MANKTSIEWTDYNWNFLRGCSRVSEGCRNCYAEGIAARFSGEGWPYHGLAKMVNHDARWTGEISYHEDILMQALRWKKPRRVFVNSMSDLFHEKVKDGWLDKAFAVMALTPQHTYQILTKRPERMREYFTKATGRNGSIQTAARSDGFCIEREMRVREETGRLPVMQSADPIHFPLPNIWLGVSVEDQKTADERIPLLIQTPAAIRWLSCEPLLGPIDFFYYGGDHGDPISFSQLRGTTATDPDIPGIDWVVVGGESGHGARPVEATWLKWIIRQCRAAEVPVFVKQLGANYQDAENGIAGCQTKVAEEYGSLHIRLRSKKGGDMNEWPEDLRIREMPEVSR